MIRSCIVLASALTGMTLAGTMSAGAQTYYIDEGAYPVPPAYVAPAVPPAYYVAPPGYVAAAPAYTAPAAPLAVIPVTPPAYAAVPTYVPRERRHVIVERRPAYPRYDYGYVTYEEW